MQRTPTPTNARRSPVPASWAAACGVLRKSHALAVSQQLGCRLQQFLLIHELSYQLGSCPGRDWGTQRITAGDRIVGFAEAIRSAFAKYADFDGRASRPEFWYFLLFYIVVATVLGAIVVQLAVLVVLIILPPLFSVMVRRLHDTGRSGWWALFGIIPLFFTVVLLPLACLKGEEGPNRYGDPPAQSPPGRSQRPSHLA
jgi:uncharacterized membrane protein YhaH (DUF805 family)